jgi:hypothetical protein
VSLSGAFAVLILAAAAQAQTLQTVAPILSLFEDGGAIPAADRLTPGETVFFRFSLAGYKTSSEGKVAVTGHVQAFDPAGLPIAPKDELVIATSLRDEDKDWKPILHFQFMLPPLARSGTYRIRYEATDDQTHTSASSETTFLVGGHDVPASSQLVIRNLGFFRNPDDETPLRVAAYRAGDMVWVKFDVTGYKYGEQNAIDVSYDVQVSSPDGKTLFSQEDAAVERSQAFYPQPWVPGNFSLTTQANMKPGAYRVEITARDAIGHQEAKAQASFQVE